MILQDGVEVNTSIYDIILLLKEHISAQGIKLLGAIKDSPDNVMVSCPYHKNGQERRPSAGIKKTDGTFHCFACEEVHTLPEFISHCFGENDGGAYGYKWLLQNYVLISKEDRRNVELDFIRPEVTRGVDSSIINGRFSADTGDNLSESNSRRFVSEEELDKYRVIHPYWAKRGITNPEVIELFDLGYDKETECITFPVRDLNGNCLFVARRSVKTKFFNYPSGAEKPLYGLYELNRAYRHGGRGGTYIIVTESMLDALSFWTIGKPAVALNGLGNELQYQQLRDLYCRTVILATDMDEAGKKAREKLRRELPNKIIFEYNFPNGKKDANECTAEELRSLEKIM